MDRATLSALEYQALKDLIAPFIKTPGGARVLVQLVPASGRAEVAARKIRASEAMAYHLEGGRVGPGGLDDPEPILHRLGPDGAVLDAVEISRLVGVMQAADALRQNLAAARDTYPHIWKVASEIPDLRGATRPIAGKISADGRIEDSASADLARIRRRVAELESSLQRALQQILDAGSERGLLQDSYITIRNGRFVIPVRAEARTAVPGVVHGASSTGATVFVEPMQTLEVNNELATLRDDEAAEVRRILAAWSELLRARRPEIAAACDRLADLDLLGAIAIFGINYRCNVAADAEGSLGAGRIHLIEARHPVLESGLKARGADPVPLTIELPAGGVLVLSGPNAGGKTVALKTVGLLALMNQSGLPVPAAEAVLPIFNQVLADIGDHQSIMESLSTFSARMVRVAEMSRCLEPPALVLLDEVGAGTDPEEAGALAVAIVDHFKRRSASLVATTHHESLKAYAESSPGAVNASMEIDEKTMRPTFHLISGVAGRSGGVDLASRVGLPEEVVADARARLSSGHREAKQYLARLQELTESRQREEELLVKRRSELEVEREKLRDESRKEIDSLRRSWEQAIDAALSRIEQAREQFISGISDRTIALQLRAESRRQTRELREQLERAASPPAVHDGPEPGPGQNRPTGGKAPPRMKGPDGLVVGARVRVEGMRDIAVVESIDGRGRAQVTVKGKRLSVAAKDLKPIEAPDESPGRKVWALSAGVRFNTAGKLSAPSEINLIGATVEGAADKLDKFLDDAFLAGHREVRIVHGHGTGRLKAAVLRLIEKHPHVESHADADERAGGTGATVAVLRL